MDKNEMLLKIAAILTALADCNGSPESMLYIFCDMDMDKWTKLRYVLVESKLVSIKSNYVTLTPQGIETAAKLNKAISN